MKPPPPSRPAQPSPQLRPDGAAPDDVARYSRQIGASIDSIAELGDAAKASHVVLPTKMWLRVILTGMDRRPLTLSAQDPLALFIAAGLGVAAELGMFDGYSSALTVQLCALLMALAAIIRHVFERRRDASLGRVFATIIDKVPEAKETIDEIRQRRQGAPGEGGQVPTPLPDDDTPPADPKRQSRRGLVRLSVLALFVLASIVFLLAGCAGLSTYQKPGLGDLIARVDLVKVRQCAAQPTARDKARCLGVEVLTQGLDFALQEAGKLAEAAIDAANPHAGAAISERDRRKLARDLDRSLNVLAHELAAVE